MLFKEHLYDRKEEASPERITVDPGGVGRLIR